jgi:hypothetical protein
VLQGMYEGVRHHAAGQRQVQIFGREMTAGRTEKEAAGAFIDQHRGALGRSDLEVRPLWDSMASNGRSAVFAYRQVIRGKEVDGSMVCIKVKRGPVARVDYAAARIARGSIAGSEAPVIPAEVAASLVLLQPGSAGRVVEGEPELVVLLGDATRPDTWCWRIRTTMPGAATRLPRVYFVDTAIGTVVHARDQHFGQDATTGTVESLGTIAEYPWHPYIPEQTPLTHHRIPGLRVVGTVGSSSAHTFTDGAGNYTLQLGTTAQAITLDAFTANPGQWYEVTGYGGLLRSIENSTVGSHVPHTLNNPNTIEERRVALADAIVGVANARAFFKQYISSTLPGLNYKIYLMPNQPDICGAGIGYSPGQHFLMIFGAASDDPNNPPPCWNWGTHAVAAHEYGHASLWMLEIAFESARWFHEGYSDAYLFMVTEDSVVGRSHWRDGTAIRADPRSPHINCQYPLEQNTTPECYCDGNGHKGGQLLSAIWLRIRDGMIAALPPGQGIEHARQTFGAWSLLTLGGVEDTCSPAHHGTAVEILAVVDEELFQNLVCESLAEHSVPCP